MQKKPSRFNRESLVDANSINAFARTSAGRKVRPRKAAEPVTYFNKDQSIFMSYARKDLHLVQPFVNRLKNIGVNVEWDQGFLSGVELENQIQTLIEAATVVIVVWSPASILSRFVRDEAQLAAESGKLAPVITHDLPASKIPLGFRSLQAILISDFDVIKQSLIVRGIKLGAHTA